MTEFKLLAEEHPLNRSELTQLYNDAVETIWHLQEKYALLDEDYEDLLYDYEQVTNKLYG